MLQYETIFITDPLLTEDELEAAIKTTDLVITSAGGKVLKIERWGKRRLAYPIGHREEGIYVLLTHECPPDALKEIDRRFRMNERVIRHLTVRVEHQSQLGPSPMMKSRPAERDETPAQAPAPPPAQPPTAP